MDGDMFPTVASLQVPYILMHMQGTPDTMQLAPHYENVSREVTVWLAERIDRLHQMGCCDIIADPGFGFGKTLEHNYELLNHLEDLKELNVPLLPRMMTEYAHSRTGIDIHPGATIGSYFFIDHGTGIVVGETTVIGDHVKLYQGVTLGALSPRGGHTSLPGKRHPTVESGATIYSGASILGGDTVIGHDSEIGGSVWLIDSVPPYSRVYNQPPKPVIRQIS